MKRRYKFISRIIVFTVAVSLMGGVVIYLDSMSQQAATASVAKEVSVPPRPVTVVRIEPGDYAASAEVFGEVRPRWQSMLRAQVGGKIVEISDHLLPGSRVKKGDVLVRLEKSEYRARLAEASNRLETARVRMLTEEQEAREAERSWKRSGLGGRPESALTLRKPQIRAARKELKAAEASVAWAERELAHTVIRAPFDALVAERHVSIGETLMARENVAVLYATDVAEIPVCLDARQWSLLPQDWQNGTVRLRDTSGSHEWQARMVRDGGRIDEKSRLRTLWLEADRPFDQTPPLLPGSFVRVILPGRIEQGLLRIPESAMTRKGEVVYTDPENRLRRFRAEPLFTKKGWLFIRPPESRPFWHIVKAPLTSYMSGMTVTPVFDEMAEDGDV